MVGCDWVDLVVVLEMIGAVGTSLGLEVGTEVCLLVPFLTRIDRSVVTAVASSL